MEKARNQGRMSHQHYIAMAAMAAVLLIVTLAVGKESRPEHVRMLHGASSAEHLWFVVPSDRDPDRWRLLHHAREMEDRHYSPKPMTLPRQPEAMAAQGNRVWLIFPPGGDGQPWQRGAFTAAVERDHALEMYRPSPRDRLQILEALPGAGRLVAMTATDRGPVVLILQGDNEPPEDVDVADYEGFAEDVDVAAELEDAPGQRQFLLQLRGKLWRELELPRNVELTRAARLGVTGDDRSQLVLLSIDPTDQSRTVVNRLMLENGRDDSDDPLSWEQSTIDLDLQRVLAVETVRGRLVALTQEQPGDRARLRYLRSAGTLDLGELPEPRGRWNVFGMADGLRMIEYSTRDGVMMRRIDPLTGEVDEVHEMGVQPLPVGRVWYTSLLLATAVVAVLLVLLVRPSRQKKLELPKGLGVMPPIPRFFALVMDLFPGGVVSVLVLRCSPVDLLRLPIFTDSIELALPFLLMVAAMFVHTTLTELVKGTSLGKVLLGARIISTDGDRPNAKQVLLRNGVKVLILLVPVLAIFALLNPNLRGFNDLVAQTVVVGDVHSDQGKDAREDEQP